MTDAVKGQIAELTQSYRRGRLKRNVSAGKPVKVLSMVIGAKGQPLATPAKD